MTDTCETFAGRFRWSLVMAGLSPGQCDARLGWPQGYAAGLVAGSKPQPPRLTLARVADALGVSLRWLSTGAAPEAGRANAAELLAREDFGRLAPEDQEQIRQVVERFGDSTN